MKCALIEASYSFYKSHDLPKIIEYVSGRVIINFTDHTLKQSVTRSWLDNGSIVIKKVVADTRLNRTLYPEAKELDGYLILDESLKAEDFWGSK